MIFKIPLKAILRMAIRSLQVHRIRTSLALLGIIIGVAALITILSIGAATTSRLMEQVLALGNNYIAVQPGTFSQLAKITGVKKKKPVPIGQKDLQAIQGQVPYIEAISPVLENAKTISYKGIAFSGALKAGSADLFKIVERPLQSGVPFSPYQVQTAAKVAVIGSTAAEHLFGKEDPIGKSILIDKAGFVVIGLLKKIPTYQTTFTDPNLSVYVPYTAVWKSLIPTPDNSFHYLVIRAEDKEKAALITSSIKNLLRFRHAIPEGVEDDFTVFDQQELLKQAEAIGKTLRMFLLSASTISMIVGGIGIMNIMLVSIAERKREIGLRMAIGASPKAILFQFLTEALFLCLMGGVLGIGLGILSTYMVNTFSQFNALITPSSILIAFSMAFLIGLFFGLYPAYKASQLNPVEALRSY